MKTDVVRWVVVAACVFNIGVMWALYERVGRSFLPTAWMRLLLVSNAMSLVVIAVGTYSRLGHPITWRTPLLAVAALLQFVSLLGIHRWYGSVDGRAHSARMLKGRSG